VNAALGEFLQFDCNFYHSQHHTPLAHLHCALLLHALELIITRVASPLHSRRFLILLSPEAQLSILTHAAVRNGPVRKKFDGVKYVQKRLEQVIYELSVRGTVGGQQEGEKVVTEEEEFVVAGAEFKMLREKMESFDAARDKVLLAHGRRRQIHFSHVLCFLRHHTEHSQLVCYAFVWVYAARVYTFMRTYVLGDQAIQRLYQGL
jgi:hypothetical protein